MGFNYYYAVRTGHRPGVYKTWKECEAQVKNFSGAKFKKFPTKEEAEEFAQIKSSTVSLKRGADAVETINEPNSKNRKHSKSSSPELLPQNKVSSSFYSDNSNIKKTLNNQVESDDSLEIVYTDGSSRGNGKNGAKAGVGVFFGDGDPRNVSEPLQGPKQTNQRAELTAGLKAINLSTPGKDLEIRTDSRYLIQGVTSWVFGWEKKNWITSTGKNVENRDLFEALIKEVRNHKGSIKWTHVPAHTGIYGNEMADQLAVSGASKPK